MVFFGDPRNPFSNRHFKVLTECSCVLGAVVAAPKDNWTSTNRAEPEGKDAFTSRAGEMGVPVLSPENPNKQEILKKLSTMIPDIMIAVAYTKKLGPELLALPRFGVFNFHASLLPKYRGKHPVFRTLQAGDKTAGLTVHRMDGGIDTGPVLYQVKVRTRASDSVASLYSRITDKSVPLVSRLITECGSGKFRLRAQDESQGSYFSSVDESDFHIDFSKPRETLCRQICAAPGRSFFKISGEKIFVDLAVCGPGTGRLEAPGTILKIGSKNVLVSAGNGSILLQGAADRFRYLGLSAGMKCGKKGAGRKR